MSCRSLRPSACPFDNPDPPEGRRRAIARTSPGDARSEAGQLAHVLSRPHDRPCVRSDLGGDRLVPRTLASDGCAGAGSMMFSRVRRGRVGSLSVVVGTLWGVWIGGSDQAASADPLGHSSKPRSAALDYRRLLCSGRPTRSQRWPVLVGGHDSRGRRRSAFPTPAEGLYREGEPDDYPDREDGGAPSEVV